MATFQTDQQQQQNSLLFADCLYCEEKYLDDTDEEQEFDDFGSSNLSPLHDSSSSSSVCWEDDEEQLNVLFSREETTLFNESYLGVSELVVEARRRNLEWMISANSHHNFSAITLVLGVNYYDRFMLSFAFQREKPWMTHLAALACLSLAAKVEEIYVPPLLHFQVEHKQIFEAKVIQRMELLVLSTLDWKMNAVTPLSYFGPLIRKLNLNTNFHWKILTRCESLILSALLDPRFLCYAPSVLAAASMVQTLKEIGLWSTLEHQNDTMDTLRLDKEKVEECYNFIQEMSSKEITHKRKWRDVSATIRSPNTVLDVESNECSIKEDTPSISSPKKCRRMGPTCFG